MITTEVELCQAGIAWLQCQHWEVYQEVELFRQSQRADIVAYRKPAVWIIEAKMSLSLSLLEQALYWKPYANYVSVLVPRRKRNSPGRRLLQLLGIGIMEVSRRRHEVEDYHLPVFVRTRSVDRERMVSALIPELRSGEFGEAGNNESARWTPYRHTMNQVKRFLTKRKPATIKQIIENLEEHHYSTDKSAVQSIRKALTTWEDWCVVDRSGREHLYSVGEEYPE